MALRQRKQWSEARDHLEALAARYPRDVEVLGELVNLYHDLHDTRGYQRACERLVRADPGAADPTFALAGAYLANVYPALALRTFRRALQRWPAYPHAAEASQTIAEVEAVLLPDLEQMGLGGAEGFELAVLHEEGRALLEQGQYAESQRAVEQMLRRRPDFVPALNNLSQLHQLAGRYDQAIAAAERVLALDAANVHALSNLTRYLCLSGRGAEAASCAARLKAVATEQPDAPLKKAEALSYLGDDQGVLDVFEAIDEQDPPSLAPVDPLLVHLAAVASMRLGRKDEARALWEDAQALAPGLQVVQDNLDDLEQPVGERHAPWAFDFGNWLPTRAVADLAALMAPIAAGSEASLARAIRRHLRQHPEMAALVPLLLDRGDPRGREFALQLAVLAESPELLAALRDFALGQRGPDAMRQRAAEPARAAGLIPGGLVRFWGEGEWREVLLLAMEIHDEPITRNAPHVEEWHGDALLALREGRADDAERLLTRALEVEPDDPSLLNNLASAYELQGRVDEAQAMVRQLYDQHPDYFFARISVARLATREGRLEEAHALLQPLLAQERFHVSEFAALCTAHIQLFIAEGNDDAARSWLAFWESADPEQPKITEWRDYLDKPSLPRWLLGRLGTARQKARRGRRADS